MIDAGQHTGLAQQIQNGEVNYAVVFIGVNDFAPYSSDGYPAIYDETLSDDQVSAKVTIVVENITTAIDTLQQAGEVKILLVKIPDWGNSISVQQLFPNDENRQRVSNAITSTNTKLEEIAQDKNIEIADPNISTVSPLSPTKS